MKTTMAITSVLTLVAAMSGVASAQVVGNPALIGGYAGGYGGYGYGYHSSTLEEGWLRGLGALAASQGQANYYNSLAAINVQDAYSKYIQNRQKAVDGYFYMRQANHAAREAARPQPLSYDQYVALAKKEAPEPLTSQQYNRTAGTLNWPVTLLTDDFAADRETIDEAFRTRSPGDFGPTTAFYGNIRRLTESMQNQLKAHFDELDPAQYMAAKNFLQSISYEAQQPVVVRSLALSK